jgi:short-subunit dehydrogenase
VKVAGATVLLTGASGGIGREMAKRLAEEGARVIGVGRSEPPEGLPLHAWVRGDLTMPQGLAAAEEAAAREAVSIVVHAACLPAFGPLEAIRSDDMEAVLRTNLLVPMRLAQALAPHLRRQTQARMVFVGSILGRIGVPGFSVYGASKAGLFGFVEALRREWAHTSVRVQILNPRSTRTPFNDAAVERFNQDTGTASDAPQVVAQALLRLIESDAARRDVGVPESLAARLNAVLGPLLDGAFARHRLSLWRTRS